MMIDGVILVAILVPAIIGLFSLFVNIITSTGGTKGIKSKSYKTKSGKVHTASKSREHYIV